MTDGYSSERAISSVLLIVAMKAEAEPIIQQLSLQANADSIFSTPTRTKTYSGQLGGLKVHLAHNGTCDKFDVDKVGTNAATLTTYLSIAAFKPDLVISCGTAGGFKAQGAQIASVFLSTATQNHDRRVPLPGFDKSGVGHDHSHPAERMAADIGAGTCSPERRSAACVHCDELHAGLQQGVVSTGNSLDFVEEDMKLMQEGKTAVKDMESAAVAYVCRLWSTPMLAIKAVTDIVDGGKAPQEEFLENLHKASEALQGAISRALKFIDGKALHEL